jgi:hypothetical protein
MAATASNVVWTVASARSATLFLGYLRIFFNCVGYVSPNDKMTVIGDAEDVVVAFLKYCQRLR